MKKAISLLLSALLLCVVALPAFAMDATPSVDGPSVLGKWALTGAFDAQGEPIEENEVANLFSTSDFVAEFRADGTVVNHYAGAKDEGGVSHYTFDGKQVVIEGDEEYPLTLSEDGNMLSFDIDGALTITLSRIMPVHGIWEAEIYDGDNVYLAFNYDGTVDAYTSGKLQSAGLHFAADGNNVQMTSDNDENPIKLMVVNGEQLLMRAGTEVVNFARITADKLQQALQVEGEMIETGAQDVKDETENILDAAGEEAEKVEDTVGDALDAAGEKVGEALGEAKDAVGDALNTAGEKVGEVVDAIDKETGNALTDAKDAVGDALNTAGEKIGEAAGAVQEEAGKVAEAIDGSTGGALSGAADSVGNALTAAGEQIRIASAKVIAQLEGIVDAAKISLNTAAQKIKAEAEVVETDIWDSAKKLQEKIGAISAEASAKRLKEELHTAADEIVDAVYGSASPSPSPSPAQ